MLLPNDISEKGKMKLRLYNSAMYLFDKGKSHPQIVKLLEEYEPDREILVSIVDKAMHDEWNKLFEEAKTLFSKGFKYYEVLEAICQKEPDEEIAAWICGEWYQLKALFAHCIIDGSTNRFEGMKWIIILGIGLFFLFFIGSSWIVKAIWIIALIGSITQWIVGMQQRDLANVVNNIFAADIEIAQHNDQENHVSKLDS